MSGELSKAADLTLQTLTIHLEGYLCADVAYSPLFYCP